MMIIHFFFLSLLFVTYGIDTEVLNFVIVPKPKWWYRAIPAITIISPRPVIMKKDRKFQFWQ